MATIKLGDKVRFVNENMQGVVTSLKGTTAGVTIEDDFEIPVLLSEIVRIDDILTKPNEEEKPITAKPKFVKVHSGFHLAFERLSETTLELKIHNSQTDWAMVAVYFNNQLQHRLNIELETNQSLGKFKLDEFNSWPEFTFIITPIDELFATHKTITRKFKFSAKEFHASFKQCYFLGQQAYTFRIDSDIKPDALLKLKERDFSEANSAHQTKTKTLLDLTAKPISPVNLHIEHLVENTGEWTAQEIVDIQLNAAKQTIEMAHVHHLKSVVLIHGVGNHFLKNKIKNYLGTQKDIVLRYADADMLKYGGGATEVFFK